LLASAALGGALAACAREGPRPSRAPARPAIAPPATGVAEASLDVPLARGEASLPEDAERRIDAVIAECIARGELPGAVVVIVRKHEVVFRKAYGLRSVQPAAVPMTAGTVFDLASLTKPLVTAASILLLVERGKLRLSDPVATHLGDFAQGGKGKVTVEQLLLHTSGLAASNALSEYEGGRQLALQRVFASPLLRAPGEKVLYSDLGYIVLGEIVERVSGTPLDEFARQSLFEPLRMRETTFRPDALLALRAAPTERRDGRWLVGQVHDPRAHLLGGVAGHAGLFSTASDLSRFARMLLGGGSLDGRRVLAASTVEAMTKLRSVPGGPRTLAWDLPRAGGFGHTGFTGTSMWLDAQRGSAVILLSNRLHPEGKGDATRMRREVVRVVSEADRALERDTAVLTGIDVLAGERFAALAGKRVALLTHAAARARDGSSTLDLLAHAPGVRLTAIFAPEHGLRADEDRLVPDSIDATTGVMVHSLYGKRRRPTREQLRDVDVLLVDLQDAGARFYTYLATLGYALEAAGDAGVSVMVLDRPNPTGGTIEGPLLDRDLESFTAYHRIPVRHGMTLGELARLVRTERRIPVELQVIAASGWRRRDRFETTGLSWRAPSPNLRTPTAALLYPGVGLLETTNVSVGRGTDRPFEMMGAPWIDGAKLARALEAAQLPGVRFTETRFVPRSSVHAGTECRGVALAVTDADRFEPVRTGLEVARQLRLLFPRAWDARPYSTLLGHRATMDLLLAGKPTDDMVLGWRAGLAEFEKRRAPHLIYPE
jgi:uncharacterized protein YbbC (DUF1343 family)